MSNEIDVHLENFDGPLDLLLSLVKDKKMDIFSIDLSELATAYLKIIDYLKDKDLDLASEYLVMAAQLLQIKSRTILDDPSDKDKIDEEKQNILSQLAEHQQFKQIAEELKNKELERKNIFIKEVEDYSRYAFDEDPAKLDGSSDAVKLIQVMRKMFERLHANKRKSTTIEKFNLSPSERRLELIEILNKTESPSFEQIFDVPSINHFVVTMLTILDMARKQELILEQDDQFSTISFRKGVING